MTRKLPLINLVSYIGLVVVNFLAIRLPFFGRTVGDVADLYPNHFTPADYAFSIWSFIYALLGLFIYRQSKGLFRKEKKAPPEIDVIGYLFLATCLVNVSWLVTWQSLHLTLSFVLIFILWAMLVLTYVRLAKFPSAHWHVTVPFSVYLAWVAVAGLGNLNIVLMDAGFGFFGLSDVQWTILLVGLGVFGGLLVLYLNQDSLFALVLIWALIGIQVKNSHPPFMSPEVVSATWAGIGILGLASGFTAWWKWKRR